jgi:hypothetical protein
LVLVIGEGVFLRTDDHHEPFLKGKRAAILGGFLLPGFAIFPKD